MKIKGVFIVILTAMLLASCNKQKVYDRYQHTPVVGWERNDTLKFDDIERFKAAGDYATYLGLRINGYYPFMGLTLIIDKTTLPSHTVDSDTINCKLLDRHGNSQGIGGISYYQYNMKLKNIRVAKGDSIVVSVRHNMKREILPGISDIGFMLVKVK